MNSAYDLVRPTEVITNPDDSTITRLAGGPPRSGRVRSAYVDITTCKERSVDKQTAPWAAMLLWTSTRCLPTSFVNLADQRPSSLFLIPMVIGSTGWGPPSLGNSTVCRSPLIGVLAKLSQTWYDDIANTADGTRFLCFLRPSHLSGCPTSI